MTLRQAELEAWLPAMGWPRFGIAKLNTPLSMPYYDQWLANGFHGEMDYLVRHQEQKRDAKSWLPFAQSAIVFTLDYMTDYVTVEARRPLRKALYARSQKANADYHDSISKSLTPVVIELEKRYPGHELRLAIDTRPILERDLAKQAGLGWVGKNTCLIDRKAGSLFFIAEILTSLPVTEAAVVSGDHCGTCTRCLEVCPTNALIAPRVLDARKCISYWTIESKSVPPHPIREQIGDWFFGCDLCQTVCPWNQKSFGPQVMQAETQRDPMTPSRDALIDELRQILSSSNSALEKRFAGTPLARARGFGLKRNAILVAANLQLIELRSEIKTVGKKSAGLYELSTWACAKLNGATGASISDPDASTK